MIHRTLPLLLLLACEGGKGDFDAILALEGDATAGATVFADNCASCHGTDATGGSGPDLTAEADEADEELLEYIVYGEEDMPSFDGVLDDQEMADVLAYIHSL